MAERMGRPWNFGAGPATLPEPVLARVRDVVADLRGSFAGYSETFSNPPGVVSSAPTNVDRPDFTGHVDGRLDVTRDTRLLGQVR